MGEHDLPLEGRFPSAGSGLFAKARLPLRFVFVPRREVPHDEGRDASVSRKNAGVFWSRVASLESFGGLVVVQSGLVDDEVGVGCETESGFSSASSAIAKNHDAATSRRHFSTLKDVRLFESRIVGEDSSALGDERFEDFLSFASIADSRFYDIREYFRSFRCLVDAVSDTRNPAVIDVRRSHGVFRASTDEPPVAVALDRFVSALARVRRRTPAVANFVIGATDELCHTIASFEFGPRYRQRASYPGAKSARPYDFYRRSSSGRVEKAQ